MCKDGSRCWLTSLVGGVEDVLELVSIDLKVVTGHLGEGAPNGVLLRAVRLRHLHVRLRQHTHTYTSLRGGAKQRNLEEDIEAFATVNLELFMYFC